MQAFSLDQASGLPVKLQLKAHIKYQAMAGILRPGDQLPPLRDLAAGLGINLNTVVRAMNELEAEGYVYTHQGKGVFIADEFPGQGHGAALRSLMAGVISSAREWGMAPEEMALALLAHGQLARPPQAAPYRLLLVAGSRPHFRRLQGELEGALPAVVVTALPEEVPDRLRSGDFRVVVCTLFHEAGLKEQVPNATLITLAGQAQRDLLGALGALPPGATVAIAARDWLHAARIRHSLERCGLDSLRLEIAAGQSCSALAPVLSQASFVLAASDCLPLVREALSGRPGIPLLAEPMEVTADALSAIRRALGAPAEVQRVHVRSAWV